MLRAVSRHNTRLSNKVVFADQLRGLAALVVVLTHMFNVYPFAQAMVATTVGTPPLNLPTLWITPAMAQSWINFGPLGVGLFFLVSGFVIPFSLRRHGRGAFLLARALRIYPTYWAALAIGCLLVVASARYWGRPTPFNWESVWANLTLSHTLRGIPSIDQVNWTLVVELHFYVLAALTRPWILNCRLWPMLAAVAGALGLLAAQRIGLAPQPSFSELVAMLLPYMLIGTAFHYHYVGALRFPLLWAVVAGLSAVSFSLSEISPTTAVGNPVLAASYGYALLLFSIAYAARNRIPDWRALRLLARISYPLYSVHLLVGFTLMTWLIAGPAGLPYGWASIATLAVLLLVAWVLHQGVERWTIRWGAALGKAGVPAPAAGD